MLNLIPALLTPNSQRAGGNRPGIRISPAFGVAHSTANPEASARANRDFFDTIRPDAESSAHTVTDWQGTLVCIPFEPANAEKAWHCGATANRLSIGHELCETNDSAKFAASYANYCDLWAYTCGLYGWSPARIFGHWMVSALYPGDTDHQDPMDYLRGHGVEWHQFMVDVERRIKSPDAPYLVNPVDILCGGKTVACGFLGSDNRAWARVAEVGAGIGFKASPVNSVGGRLVAVKLERK